MLLKLEKTSGACFLQNFLSCSSICKVATVTRGPCCLGLAIAPALNTLVIIGATPSLGAIPWPTN